MLVWVLSTTVESKVVGERTLSVAEARSALDDGAVPGCGSIVVTIDLVIDLGRGEDAGAQSRGRWGRRARFRAGAGPGRSGLWDRGRVALVGRNLGGGGGGEGGAEAGVGLSHASVEIGDFGVGADGLFARGLRTSAVKGGCEEPGREQDREVEGDGGAFA